MYTFLIFVYIQITHTDTNSNTISLNSNLRDIFKCCAFSIFIFHRNAYFKTWTELLICSFERMHRKENKMKSFTITSNTVVYVLWENVVCYLNVILFDSLVEYGRIEFPYDFYPSLFTIFSIVQTTHKKKTPLVVSTFWLFIFFFSLVVDWCCVNKN